MDLTDLTKVLVDPRKRVSNLYKVVDKNGLLIPFRPNIVQERVLGSRRRKKMVLKARQMGVSTLELIRMLDFVTWNENKIACILAHEQDSIKKLFRVVKTAHHSLDPLIKPELDRGGGSMYEMRFPAQNSKIYVDLESRSDTLHWLHISEAAFIKEPEKVKATMQAVPINGVITIESTANGIGNWFYDTWFDESSSYEKHFFPWYIFPEYQIESPPLEWTDKEKEFAVSAYKHFNVTITDAQLAFRRSKQSELKSLFRQEYPEDDASCFLASGSSAMDLYLVSQLLKKAPKPISDDGMTKVWKQKKNTSRYVCAVDTSEGISGDYCVASLFDKVEMEQVAVLRGRWKPFEFAERIVEFLEPYVRPGEIWPLLAVERNNHGHAVLLQLEHHLKYRNLYRHTDDKMGWLTDRLTRPVMIDCFIDGVENGTVTLNDATTLQECLTLVENEGKIEAATGKHDDCVMASSIAVQLCIKMGSLDLYENIGKMIRV